METRCSSNKLKRPPFLLTFFLSKINFKIDQLRQKVKFWFSSHPKHRLFADAEVAQEWRHLVPVGAQLLFVPAERAAHGGKLVRGWGRCLRVPHIHSVQRWGDILQCGLEHVGCCCGIFYLKLEYLSDIFNSTLIFFSCLNLFLISNK